MGSPGAHFGSKLRSTKGLNHTNAGVLFGACVGQTRRVAFETIKANN